MHLKNCKNCNTEFNSTPKLKIYCSKKCSDRARKDQLNKYHKEYQKRPHSREKLSQYNKQDKVKKAKKESNKKLAVREAGALVYSV